jgi:predicted hydrocarbon binding protein
MPAPEVSIEVDAETGHWITDGAPMIYTPRTFFVNIQKAAESAIGEAGYRDQIYRAAYDATYAWCSLQAELHGISGIEVFHHYLDRLSKRGWGKFTLIEADAKTGSARTRLDHSAIAAGFGKEGRCVCYMFDGAFAAAMDWIGDNRGQHYRTGCRELQCAAQQGRDHCLFEVRAL